MAKKSADSSEVYNIVALCFTDKSTGQKVAKEVRSQQKLEGYKVIAEAVVEVDEKGKPHIHEPGRGGFGGTVGVVAGGLLGLIGGPAGLLAWAVAGGVIGGVAGHYAGRMIPAADLEELGRQMSPNSSAFLALVEDTEAEKVIDQMKGYNAKVVTLTVGDEASQTISTAISADITVPATVEVVSDSTNSIAKDDSSSTTTNSTTTEASEKSS